MSLPWVVQVRCFHFFFFFFTFEHRRNFYFSVLAYCHWLFGGFLNRNLSPKSILPRIRWRAWALSQAMWMKTNGIVFNHFTHSNSIVMCQTEQRTNGDYSNLRSWVELQMLHRPCIALLLSLACSAADITRWITSLEKLSISCTVHDDVVLRRMQIRFALWIWISDLYGEFLVASSTSQCLHIIAHIDANLVWRTSCTYFITNSESTQFLQIATNYFIIVDRTVHTQTHTWITVVIKYPRWNC